MASFIAHATAGAIIGRTRQASWFELPILIGFCWAPDIDYLFPVLFDQHPTVRWTHSFAAVLVLWATLVAAVQLIPPLRGTHLAISCLLAGLSHLLLDYLVGGQHGDPLLWPVSTQSFSTPVGLLPAAGRIDLQNIYLWRNLLIEIGIFGPILWSVWHMGAKRPRASSLAVAAAVFIPFVLWGISLAR